jgi:hypothetical protein
MRLVNVGAEYGLVLEAPYDMGRTQWEKFDLATREKILDEMIEELGLGYLLGPWEVNSKGEMLFQGEWTKNISYGGKQVRWVKLVPVPKPDGATRPCAHFSKEGSVIQRSINDCITDDSKTIQFPHLLDIAAFAAVATVAAKADLRKYYRQISVAHSDVYLQGLEFGSNPRKRVLDDRVRFGIAPAGRICSIPVRALNEGYVRNDPDFVVQRSPKNRPTAIGLQNIPAGMQRKRRPKRKKCRELVPVMPWLTNCFEWYRRWVGGVLPLHVMDSIMDDAWCMGHEGDVDPVKACKRRLDKILSSREGGLQWKDGSDGRKSKTIEPTFELPLSGWWCNLKEKWISIPLQKRQKIRTAIQEVLSNRTVSFESLPRKPGHRISKGAWHGFLS